MGDRTLVELTVLTEHLPRVEAIYEKVNLNYYLSPPFACLDEGVPGEQDTLPRLITLAFENVNYAELPCLNELLHEGIAFDYNWQAGSSYGEGKELSRYDNDGVSEVTNQEGHSCSIGVSELEIRTRRGEPVEDIIAGIRASMEVRSWTHQARNGEKYRAMQLLLGKES